jgi:hypothetical protein
MMGGPVGQVVEGGPGPQAGRQHHELAVRQPGLEHAGDHMDVTMDALAGHVGGVGASLADVSQHPRDRVGPGLGGGHLDRHAACPGGVLHRRLIGCDADDDALGRLPPEHDGAAFDAVDLDAERPVLGGDEVGGPVVDPGDATVKGSQAAGGLGQAAAVVGVAAADAVDRVTGAHHGEGRRLRGAVGQGEGQGGGRAGLDGLGQGDRPHGALVAFIGGRFCCGVDQELALPPSLAVADHR